MTQLILTEITRMGPGRCIIGLEAIPAGYRSVRPLPRYGNSWPEDFPHRRGHQLEFQLATLSPTRPHIEDRLTLRFVRKVGECGEEELVQRLRRAEMADRLHDLFHCQVHHNPTGRGYFVEPADAARSICGTELRNLRFFPHGDEIRAELLLPDETRVKLPLVDTEWRRFLEQAASLIIGANQKRRMERFLLSRLPQKLLGEPTLLARIGVTRPFMGKCWLMLDSLFPQPKEEWLHEMD